MTATRPGFGPPTDVRPDPAAYGAAFRSIYDLVFPMDETSCRTAQFLFDLTPPTDRRLAEYGVGTGRVAVPLARLGAAVQGVDISPDLLAQAGTTAAGAGVDLLLEQGDLRDWLPTSSVPVAYCVCATLSMLAGHQDVVQALTTMRRAVPPDGTVVIETHHPAAVQAVHTAAVAGPLHVPVPGLAGGLSMTSSMSQGVWTLRHRWSQNGVEHRAVEHSLVLPPPDLAALARRAGLGTARWFSSWDGDPPDPTRPTVIAVFSR